MIKDIHIQNYYGITDLKINDCKQINLLVGRNEVRKEKILRFVFDIGKVSSKCFSKVENGLHYTDMKDFWLQIIKFSISNNVQIFATTHSYEMIKALVSAAKETNFIEEDKIRLFKIIKNSQEKFRSLKYDSEMLESSVKEGIEVR